MKEGIIWHRRNNFVFILLFYFVLSSFIVEYKKLFMVQIKKNDKRAAGKKRVPNCLAIRIKMTFLCQVNLLDGCQSN